MKDPYEVLGVTPDASLEQVKESYRALAKKYHPDNYADSPLKDLAEEKMTEVNAAYDAVMSDIKRRGQSGGHQSYQYQNQNSNQYRKALNKKSMFFEFF